MNTDIQADITFTENGQVDVDQINALSGDPYVAQVLDVITHPQYRRRGIASECMRAIVSHLRSSQYASVTLTDGSGIPGFYERFGFKVYSDIAMVWKPST